MEDEVCLINVDLVFYTDVAESKFAEHASRSRRHGVPVPGAHAVGA